MGLARGFVDSLTCLDFFNCGVVAVVYYKVFVHRKKVNLLLAFSL